MWPNELDLMVAEQRRRDIVREALKGQALRDAQVGRRGWTDAIAEAVRRTGRLVGLL